MKKLIKNSNGLNQTGDKENLSCRMKIKKLFIINISAGQTANASVSWNATCGHHEMYVLISPFNEFLEENYTNNKAFKIIHVGDLNQDGIITKDYNDLMTAYKCFLGINKNCDNYYQNWNLINQEYQCVVKLSGY